jgi:hypothetical protein
MRLDEWQLQAVLFLLLVFTAGMILVRLKAQLDNNWPVFYWLVVLWFAQTQRDTWDFNFVIAGAVAALLLRYEFMAPGLVILIQVIEFAVWGYILYQGCILVFL